MASQYSGLPSPHPTESRLHIRAQRDFTLNLNSQPVHLEHLLETFRTSARSTGHPDTTFLSHAQCASEGHDLVVHPVYCACPPARSTLCISWRTTKRRTLKCAGSLAVYSGYKKFSKSVLGVQGPPLPAKSSKKSPMSEIHT